MVNEGSDHIRLVMTYERLISLQQMINSVRNQWSVADDFAYLVLEGGMAEHNTNEQLGGNNGDTENVL
jgi:hypothetical protein